MGSAVCVGTKGNNWLVEDTGWLSLHIVGLTSTRETAFVQSVVSQQRTTGHTLL